MFEHLATLLPLLARYRWLYVLGISALIVTSGGQLLIPLFTGRAVDILLSSDEPARAVLPTLARLLGVAIVVGVSRFVWRLGIHGASRRIETDLRRSLFHHLTVLSPDYYDDVRTGDLMARATNDMNAVRMATGMAFVAFFDGLFMTVAILSILIARNARLTLLTVLPLPVITVLIILMGRRVRHLFATVQEGFARLSEQAQEVFSGIRVVKSFAKERFFLRRFASANDHYQNQNMVLVRLWGLFFPIVAFLSGVTVVILLWVGGKAIIAGTLTPGDFVATLAYLQMLIWPMLGAGFTVNMLQRGAASVERINKVLDAQPTIANGVDPRVPRTTTGIEVKNLSFAFGETTVLEDISFSLADGATLGIIGRTGSGKSTLVGTFLRTVDPPDGTVFVDGEDVRRWDLDALRHRFGYVPQETFLFSATIIENISFARPDADEAEVIAVGTTAGIDRDVAEFPEGWNTLVGERGVTLSGGQKQRIALARALLADPQILVMDDSLSAVDSETEERILASLRKTRAGKTTVIVSNRVSVIRDSDLILVLEGGRVTQQGRHEELFKRPGLYQTLARIQQIEATERER